MLFDLYNWTKNTQSRNIILTALAEENPDILCLQEFYTSEEKGDFNNIDTVTGLLNAKNHHIEYTTTLRGNDHWGIATFTKFPIIKKEKLNLIQALIIFVYIQTSSLKTIRFVFIICICNLFVFKKQITNF